MKPEFDQKRVAIVTAATSAAIIMFSSLYPGSHESVVFLLYLVAIGIVGVAVAVIWSAPAVRCAVCGAPRPRFRRPSDWSQAMWGGGTCDRCGSKVDRFGRLIK